jgi:lipopolysaccharide export system protein LptC
MKTVLTADRFRIWSIVALLTVATLCCLWLLEVMRHSFTEDDNSRKNRSEPDYYVEHFDYIRLSNTEKSSYHMTGERLTHHPDKDNYVVTQPLINSFNKDKTPVAVRAEKAIVEQKISPQHAPLASDEIHMYGNVIVERPQTPTSNYMRLNSEYLLFLPDSDTMETDKAVTIFSKNSTATAIGMKMNNRTQQMDLLSQVNMTMLPTTTARSGGKP